MAQIKTPEFPESVHEASVGAWFKTTGDAVGVGEAILELHTDKAVQEINAIEDGVITAILRQVDEIVHPGDPLFEFTPATDIGASALESGDAPTDSASVEPESPDPEPAVVATEADEDIAVASVDEAPEISDLIEFEVAQPIPMSSSIVEDERDQSWEMVEIESEDAPTEEVADTVSVAGTLTELDDTPSDPSSTDSDQDVRDIPSEESSGETAEGAGQPLIEAEQAAVSARPSQRVKLTRRQLTAARRMVEVKQNTVMTTTFNEVDMTQIIDMRSRHGERFLAQHDVKLGFMSFFVKAVCAALKSYPVLNAEIQDEELVLKEYYDVGVAVASERGLVVPVIRDADEMTFGEIELAIRGFAEKASTGSWSLSDLAGGTFTITNGGVFGSMLSTPILNPPQVGILGMHNIIERPIAVDGEVAVRPMMYLALTYDHRIVEGAHAVQFLRLVKESLEAADVLLLGT